MVKEFRFPVNDRVFDNIAFSVNGFAFPYRIRRSRNPNALPVCVTDPHGIFSAFRMLIAPPFIRGYLPGILPEPKGERLIYAAHRANAHLPVRVLIYQIIAGKRILRHSAGKSPGRVGKERSAKAIDRFVSQPHAGLAAFFL